MCAEFRIRHNEIICYARLHVGLSIIIYFQFIIKLIYTCRFTLDVEYLNFVLFSENF